MGVDNVMHMNHGDGESSYAKNSNYQRAGISNSLSVLDDALNNMLDDPHFGSTKCYKLVDMGCSSGPNSLWAMTHVVDKIESIYREKDANVVLEFEVYLNDLPDNDFNSLFKSIPDLVNYDNGRQEDRRVMYYGLPGSFYRRLFGEKTLHFGYSSYSLHWLSQVPEGLDSQNKENIYVAEESSVKVRELYLKQFERDFTTFLRLRSEEMIQGGRMVLLFCGSSVESPYDDCASITLLANTLSDMVKEGLVKKEDLYSFNDPIYAPCKAEVDVIIENEGSFTLDKIEDFRVPWVPKDDNVNNDFQEDSKFVTHGIRCVYESRLTKHFGSHIINPLFERYAKKVEAYMPVNKTTLVNIVLSVTRK